MLYIDQPTTTGFSYSEPVPAYYDANGDTYLITLGEADCPDYAEVYGTCGTYSYPDISATANSTANAAPNFWKTLQAFMGVFPQYSSHGFHFATESYGGHYGPIFSDYIQSQNQLINDGCLPGAQVIDQRTLMIGNGW